MLKRLLRMAVPSVMLLAMVSVVTPASASSVYFQMTVNSKAVLNADRTIATVSGTYVCAGDINFDNSGFGFQLSQIQGKNRVVTGGGGSEGPLTCNGVTQDWSADVFANDANGQPATWKNGKATFTAGGGVCDFSDNCNGTNLQTVLHLS